MDNFTWYNPTKIILDERPPTGGADHRSLRKARTPGLWGRQRDRYGKGDRTWRRR